MNAEETAMGLDAMAWQIRNWLDWHKTHRDRESLVTDDGTHIMSLPVPFWPSHGAFEQWIKTMNEAARLLRADITRAQE